VHVKIERSGGIVGRPAVGEREDGELSVAERAAVLDLLRAQPASGSAAGADRFHYKVTIEDAGKVTVLEVPENAMPEVLARIPQIRL
jgi:hypothetical protein